MGYRLLGRVRLLALRSDYAMADTEMNQVLGAEHSLQDVLNELSLFSSDCQKIGLDDAMFWAAKWVAQLDTTAAVAHVRILNYYERKGLWAELSAAMERADAEVPIGHLQRPFLNRTMSRIKRKLGAILPRTAN